MKNACMLLGVGILLALPLSVDGWQGRRARCPYLDEPRPFFDLEWGVTGNARTENDGSRYAQMELRSEAALGYFHDILQGDMDLGLRLDQTMPMRRAAFRAPRHLMVLAVDGRWFWRYNDVTAFELQFAPGIYASSQDLLDSPLNMPVTASGVFTLDRSLALVAGLQVRHGFQYRWVPHAGVAWHPHPQFRLDAMVPETRMTVHLDRAWACYAGWSWESTTYHVKPDLIGRDRLTITNQEIYMGVSHAFSPELQVYGSLGWLMDRQLRRSRSHSGARESIDIDDAPIIRMGVSGAF